MFVDHHRRRPGETLAHFHHGARERGDFIEIERKGRARGDKRGEMNVDIATTGDVADDRAERALIEAAAIHAPSHVSKRVKRRRMTDGYVFTIGYGQAFPRRLGQPRFIDSQPIVLDLVERCDHAPITSGQEHASARGQPFGLADVTIGAHQNDRVVLREKLEALGHKMRSVFALPGRWRGAHASSYLR